MSGGHVDGEPCVEVDSDPAGSEEDAGRLASSQGDDADGVGAVVGEDGFLWAFVAEERVDDHLEAVLVGGEDDAPGREAGVGEVLLFLEPALGVGVEGFPVEGSADSLECLLSDGQVV